MFEIADFSTDPLTLLIAQEEEAECVEHADNETSVFMAAMHRTKTFERERLDVDMLGASPAELAEMTFRYED